MTFVRHIVYLWPSWHHFRATNKLYALQKLCHCPIYMVKPVGPRFGQMVRKRAILHLFERLFLISWVNWDCHITMPLSLKTMEVQIKLDQWNKRFRTMQVYWCKHFDRWILSRNRVYHLYKSVPFSEKRPRRPETGLNGFEEMENEFPFGIFRQEKQDYHFRCFATNSWKSSDRTTQNVVFHLVSKRIFPKRFVNGKQLSCSFSFRNRRARGQ